MSFSGKAELLNWILRLDVVLDSNGLSESSFRRDIRKGLATRPVKLGARASGWPANEIAVLNAARIAGKSQDEIKAIVIQLEAARGELK